MILPHDPHAPSYPPNPSSNGVQGDTPSHAERADDAVSTGSGSLVDATVRWTPFDPGDAPELPAAEDGAGRVVAMIASIELIGVGWAVAVASELARVWAEQRPGVVLVDTDLARPRLHHAVRVHNGVGLAEVLRGETTVANATRVVDEDRLFCVPAGNAPEDPAQGFDPTQWARLCRAFSAAGVTVVAYVPVQASWIDEVLETATDVVLLAEQGRRLQWPREGAPPLRAVLGPMPLKNAPSDPTGQGRIGSAPLLGFDPPSDDPDPNAVDEPVQESASAADVEGLQPPSASAARRARKEAARRRGRRQTVVGALLLLAAFAAWALFRPAGAPDSAPLAGTPPAEPSPAITAVRTAPDGPVATARPVPPAADFSVGVASYSDSERARARMIQLAEALPTVPWMVAPLEIEGAVYHRVVAGLTADSSAADALGAELTREGVGIADFIVRETGWVVVLGAATERQEVEIAVDRARDAGIPAYVASIQLTDGSERFAAYAGAYRDEGEAEYLLQQALDSGLDAQTTRRMGRPPG